MKQILNLDFPDKQLSEKETWLLFAKIDQNLVFDNFDIKQPEIKNQLELLQNYAAQQLKSISNDYHNYGWRAGWIEVINRIDYILHGTDLTQTNPLALTTFNYGYNASFFTFSARLFDESKVYFQRTDPQFYKEISEKLQSQDDIQQQVGLGKVAYYLIHLWDNKSKIEEDFAKTCYKVAAEVQELTGCNVLDHLGMIKAILN
jgi:hypothetical protein